MRLALFLFAASLWGQSVVPVLTPDQMAKLLALLGGASNAPQVVTLTTTDPARLVWTLPAPLAAGARVKFFQEIPNTRISDMGNLTSPDQVIRSEWKVQPKIDGVTVTFARSPVSDRPVMAEIWQ